MKSYSITKWFRNVSIAKKLYFTVGIMALLIIIEVAALIFSINTLSSVRAYVNGEGLWSKAQKDAMYQLMKYARTHQESDFAKFRDFMGVSNGDHQTLVELNREFPDMEKAKQGFIDGRNHPEDVNGMINLFRRFHRVSYIHKAIGIWTDADRMVTKFVPIGEKLHDEISKNNFSQDSVNKTLSEIDPINAQLTILEDQFSYTLGEGSRWLEYVILRLLFGIAITVECTGLLLAITVSRNIQKGLNEILQSAKSVAKGDFSRKAIVYSKDEIGILANNFNEMSRELEESMREIQQVHQKFKNLLEAAPDAIVIVDDTETIQIVNVQAENVFGYCRNEIIGKNIDLLLPDRYNLIQKDRGQQFNSFLSPKMQQMGEGFELFARKKNGKKFPVEISLSPLETEEGLLILAAIRDITEKKQLENKIIEINVNLEKTVNIRTNELERKNKELEQFAYVASHDLQEPIRTTSSFVELLRQKYQGKLDADADKYMSYIIQSSDRMKTLIKDLLDYSRIGRKTEMKKIDCNILLQEVIDDLGRAIKEGQAQIRNGHLPVINGYPTELKQVFQNLISNSIKFRQKNIPPQITICAQKADQYWKFSVKDNGIGLDEKYQEKIFIIFQRLHTRSEYEGSGIGLAHCKKIAELHQGKIWVDSTPGKGSTFYFTILEM